MKCPKLQIVDYYMPSGLIKRKCFEKAPGVAEGSWTCDLSKTLPVCKNGIITQKTWDKYKDFELPKSKNLYAEFKKLIHESGRFERGVASEVWLMCEMLCLLIEKHLISHPSEKDRSA